MATETIALIVTVIIFLITTILNNLNIIDDRKKRWYVEIIINSNLEKIDCFFKLALEKFKTHKKNLTSNHENVGNEYLIDKAKSTKEINDLQNKFQFEIIPIFKSYDNHIAKDLSNILERFRDYYTDNIGIETIKTAADITDELEEIKSSFYKRLYKPVTNSLYNNLNLEKLLLWVLLVLFIVLFLIK